MTPLVLCDMPFEYLGRRTLNIHTPLFGVETESLQRALLAQALRSINVFISTIVTGTRVSLGVFVWLRLARAEQCGGVPETHTLHHTAQRIEDGLRGEILGGDQVDKVLLAVFLLELVSAAARPY